MEGDHSFDPSLNILHKRYGELDSIFYPKTVAVIGATEKERSVGRTVLWNLLSSPFGGIVFPVNPKRPSIMGIKAYPNVKEIPEKVDLAVIVVPAKFVPGVIKECVEAGVPTAIVISAGFKEMGEPGIKLEEEIIAYARTGNMRIIGPNCLGVMNPITGLNATFAAGIAQKGNLAFISQSGALCTAVLDWSLKEKVGFSAFVSIGSMVDVSWGDLISYFGNDPNTSSILIYMESIGDPRAFLTAAKEVSLNKPIILIKAGRSEESAKAAASHTGSLAGSDEVLNAALRRVGILRVDSISDLFSMATVLSKQPRPKGPHLTIVTNAGGPGVIATDALIESGGKLADLSPKVFEELNNILPEPWSRNNPVDILGDASAEIYGKTIEIITRDKNTEGILVILTPQDMTDPTRSAMEIQKFSKIQDVPVLASWMGANSVEDGGEILSKSGIPTFGYPDKACKSFAYMWRYSYNLKAIYETPELKEELDAKTVEKHDKVSKIIQNALKEGRTILDEFESKQVLHAYDIPVVPTYIATTCEEAVARADEIGYPIVLKLFSKTITHKTDVGGVKLNLNNREAVNTAYKEIFESVKRIEGEEHFQGVTVQPMIKLEGYELILGSSIDLEFGPVLLFGTGGQLVEVFKDRSLALPPLTSTLARRMMEQTKIYTALKGVRGREAVDLSKLEQILVRFSNLIVEQKWIKEFDINPLLASPDKLLALDARIILHDPDTKEEDLPRTAVRPYPIRYVQEWKLRDATPVNIRPIRPEDEPLLIQFYKDLSQETVRQRYLKVLHYDELIAHERLIRMCFNDYDKEIALVVEKTVGKKKEILGVGRLTKLANNKEAQFAIIVKDKWQNKGIGAQLIRLLLEIAKDEKLEKVVAYLLQENDQMQAMCKKFGFQIKHVEDNLLLAEIKIQS